MIRQLNLNLCLFNKTSKRLYCTSTVFDRSFPKEIDVTSNHTNKVVKFKPVQPGHPDWDEDGWDGEMCVYAPVELLPNVKTLTVFHSC